MSRLVSSALLSLNHYCNSEGGCKCSLDLERRKQRLREVKEFAQDCTVRK